jgi:hypothetical protein
VLLDIDWYRDVLNMCIADKNITPDEEAILSNVKKKLDISDAQHVAILKELGWTPEGQLED